MSINGHNEKTDECESCGFETDELEEVNAYARTQGAGPFTPADEHQWAWMCLVCRSTLAGNTFLYPNQYDGNTSVLAASLCWGINYIASLIKEKSA